MTSPLSSIPYNKVIFRVTACRWTPLSWLSVTRHRFKQRAAICRALINDPELILADEPTGNLDSRSGQIVMDALKEINEDMHKTIIMVTHDPYFASLSKRVVLLKDGKILDTLLRQELGEGFYQKVFEYTTKL